MVLKIRGREYQVEKLERNRYRLFGKMGAKYMTMRNMRDQHLMFLLDMMGFSKAMDGVWLSDKDGYLTVVQE